MAKKSEEIQAAWSALIEAHALATRHIARAIGGLAPLTLDEYDILLVVDRAPESKLRYAALAEAALYTKSGITRVAQRLEARGFLMKEQCPEDRRGAYAVLTERGAKALKDTWEVYGSAVAQLLGSLYSGAEARTLHDLLARIIEGERGASLVDISRR